KGPALRPFRYSVIRLSFSLSMEKMSDDETLYEVSCDSDYFYDDVEAAAPSHTVDMAEAVAIVAVYSESDPQLREQADLMYAQSLQVETVGFGDAEYISDDEVALELVRVLNGSPFYMIIF